jgi:hypothetical protein
VHFVIFVITDRFSARFVVHSILISVNGMDALDHGNCITTTAKLAVTLSIGVLPFLWSRAGTVLYAQPRKICKRSKSPLPKL